MEFIIEPKRKIAVAMKTDVVVAGGGPAGFCAAVAAARNSADVLLVEELNYVGGTLACLPILGYHNYEGKQVIFGIAEELTERLVARGGSPGHVAFGRFSGITPTDSEVLKLVTREMVEEAGVKVLLHTHFADPIMDGKRIDGIITQNKSGRQAILAKVVVDATGDGDVAARAGAAFELKDRENIQPGNLLFTVNKVNVYKMRLAILQNPSDATWHKGMQTDTDFLTSKYFHFGGFVRQMKAAREAGDVPSDYPMTYCWFSTQPREDEISVNMAMATHFYGTDAWDLSRAEMEARKWIPVVVNFLRKYIPGFEEAQLVSSHSSIGVRETRRIIGDYTLSEEDVAGNRSFEDGVAIAAAGTSPGHHPDGKLHDPDLYTKKYRYEGYTGCEVPYRCLLPKGIEGLLTAGRCISVTGTTLNAIKPMAQCMLIGQAAGTAAALAAQAGITPRQLDHSKIRQTLQAQGVRLLARK